LPPKNFPWPKPAEQKSKATIKYLVFMYLLFPHSGILSIS
jgi:hypothetical protein